MLQRLENANISAICPLTPMQEGIYFHFLYNRQSLSFFTQLSYRINGKLEVELVSKSLKILNSRHEVLRSVFNHEKAGKPLQVFLKEGELDFSFLDYSNLDEEEAKTKLNLFKEQDKKKLFDLNRDVLMRTCLVKLTSDRYELVWSHHHILMDGWCSGMLITEFNQVYELLTEGHKVDLPKPRPFRDYIDWLQDQNLEDAMRHWKSYLKGYAGLATLPRYFDGVKSDYDNKQEALLLDSEVMEGLSVISNKCQVTISHIMQAIWGIVLARYKGEKDVVYGVLVSGRPPSLLGVETMVGLFINTIPVRISCDDLPFSTLLLNVRQDMLKNEKYSFNSLAEIKTELELSEDLIDHAMVIENFPDQQAFESFVTPYNEEAKSENQSTYNAYESTAFEQSNYDLDIRLGFSNRQGVIVLRYNGNTFLQTQIRQVLDYVQTLVNKVIANVHINCNDLLLPTDKEWDILNSLNNTGKPFPKEKTIVEILGQQIAKNPKATAVVDENKRITYEELGVNSDKLAKLMLNHGVEQESVVGLLMERSTYMVEAIVASWKAGAAYLPLDTEHPMERLSWIIQNSDMTFLVVDKANYQNGEQLQWLSPGLRVIYCVDEENIYEIKERQNESMKRDLWEYVASNAVDDITGGGWFNSYDGSPFSREEMDEYIANTRNKLLPFLTDKTRVLEIGCASGLTMFDIAPLVGYYCGIDLSASIIAKNKDLIKERGIQNIDLYHLYAHEIDLISEENFDIIIINSVVQNFHGLNYLRDVIKKGFPLLNDTGIFFFGDIMDLNSKDAFLRSLKEHSEKHQSVDNTKLDWSEELFVSKDFFLNLTSEFTEIQQVQVTDKEFTIPNELSQYRFDAIVKVNLKQADVDADPIKKQLGSDFLVNMEATPINNAKPNGLAYIIYTSGSTGNPKGVMVEHVGMLNHLYSKVDAFQIDRDSKVMQNARQTFDISVWQFFVALIEGGATFVYSIDHTLSLPDFIGSMINDKITVAEVVPSYLDVFLEECREMNVSFPDLQFMIATGEALHRDLANRWIRTFPHIPLGNAYGPTEASDDITHLIITDEVQTGMVPLGTPIQNMQIWVIDENREVCAPGVKGEISVVGVGVGRGYLKDPDKTEKAFIDNTVNGSYPGIKLYLTGDIGYWSQDGELYYLGRKDHQVKVRGYRIELGEIESKMLDAPGVRNGAVVDWLDEGNQRYLAAYYTTDTETHSLEKLKAFLEKELPEYMIPAYFIRMESLPLTSNGKINRKALKEPLLASTGEIDEGFDTPDQERLAHVWEEILYVPVPNPSANFFKLGGHSLKATRLASLINKEFNVKIALRDIFEFPDLKSMAAKLSSSNHHIEEDQLLVVPEQDFYPTSHAQKRMWILSQFGEASKAYNVFNAWMISKDFDIKCFKQAVLEVIERHEILRTTFSAIDSEPVQIVHDVDYFEEQLIIFTQQNEGESFELQIQQLYEKASNTAFDLENGPLIAFDILRSTEGEHFCLLKIHHIICDGWSMRLLFNELISRYQALVNNRKVKYPSLPIQYKDFSVYQHQRIESDEFSRHKAYWHKVLKAPVASLKLPTFKRRPEIQSFAGTNSIFQFSRGSYNYLKQYAEDQDASLFMVLVAMVNTLFYRYTGQHDIVFGTSVAGRQNQKLEDQIGFYVNTVALRSNIDGSKSFDQLMSDVKTMVLGAFEHQEYPFDLLVDELSLERDLSRSAIFDVLVELQNFQHDIAINEGEEDDLNGHEITSYDQPKTKSIFDLNIEFREHNEDLYLTANYNTDLYTKEQIDDVGKHLEALINEIKLDTNKPLNSYDFLSETEKEILISFNVQEDERPPLKKITSSIFKHAELTPSLNAIIDNGRYITYSELQVESSKFASFLQENLVGGQSVVGCLLDNSIEQVVTTLGIWQSGNSYLPLPLYQNRDTLVEIAQMAKVTLLVTSKAYIHLANYLQWASPSITTIFCVDSDNIYDEEEVELESMNKEMWELVGSRSKDQITGGGWLSSYTGKPIPKVEMDEYAENIFEKLNPYLKSTTRVLEIGCASGITMFKIAPHVDFYLGTDMSSSILAKNEKQVEKLGLTNIKQVPCFAHEIDKLEDTDFDIVVINSVIQNFGGVNYLRKVLTKCVDKLSKKGLIYVGDIMDIDTKDDLLHDINNYRQKHGIGDKIDFEDHQFYSKTFFDDLLATIDHIDSVDHSPKLGKIKNELTKYRYDTILNVNKNRTQKKNLPSKKQLDRRALSEIRASINSDTGQVANKEVALVFPCCEEGESPDLIYVNHQALAYRLMQEINALGLKKSTQVLSNSLTDSESSIWQTFCPMIEGGTIHMLSGNDQKDHEDLTSLLSNEPIKLASLTSDYLAKVLYRQQGDFSLEKVVISNEQLHANLLKKWNQIYPKSEVYRRHSSPEVGLISHQHLVDEEQTEIALKTMKGLEVTVLNDSMRPCPVGVFGYLGLSSEGLAISYQNGGAKKNNIVEYASQNQQNHRPFFKSSQKGRWLPSGLLELQINETNTHSRVTHYDINYLENALLAIDFIIYAVARVDDNGKLIAFITVDETLKPEGGIEEVLRTHLVVNLMPQHIVQLNEFPLLLTGKVDFYQLINQTYENQRHQYVLPESLLEQKLASIWSDVLGKSTIGLYDNFFDLGGHSLKATRVVTRVEKELKVRLQLKDIFQHPTLFSLSSKILKAQRASYRTIEKVEEQAHYPLSHSQKRLWILDQLDPELKAYNIPSSYLMTGKINEESITASFELLVEHHEILRTSFTLIEGEPRQVVHSMQDSGFQVDFIDLSQVKEAEEEALTIGGQELNHHFDLSSPSLFRVKFLKLSQNRYALLLNIHHIISDGWSSDVLMKDFTTFYQKRLTDKDWRPEPLRIQYKDYAVWQLNEISSEEQDSARIYWMNKFRDEIPELDLPEDFPRPEIQDYSGDAQRFIFDKETSDALRVLSKEKGTSLYILLVSLVKLFLYKYTNERDITIGTPVSGREHADLDDQIGFYVNTLALRTSIDPHSTFEAFLNQVKEEVLTSFEYQFYPFDLLVDELQLRRDLGKTPVFNVMVTYWKYEGIESNSIEDLRIEPFIQQNNASKLDLTFHFIESSDKLGLNIEYASSIFSRERMKRVEHFMKFLVQQIIESKTQKLEQFKLIRPEEEEEVLNVYQSGDIENTQDLLNLITVGDNDHVKRDRVAILTQDDEFTFEELDYHSNKLAHFLREKHSGEKFSVALILTSSPEMVIAFTAVIKAGGVAIPVHTSWPINRSKAILKEAKVEFVITHDKERLEQFEGYDGYCFSSGQDILSKYPITAPKVKRTIDPVCYIKYNGFDDGVPKGISIKASILEKQAVWSQQNIKNTSEDTLLFENGSEFDGSFWVLFWYLSRGSKLLMLTSKELEEKPDDTTDLSYVTAVHVSHGFKKYFEKELSTQTFIKLKYFFSSSELQLPSRLSSISSYRFTEIHTCGIYYTYEEMNEVSSDYGRRGLLGSILHAILDENGGLVPIGNKGEIVLKTFVETGYFGISFSKNTFSDPILPRNATYRDGALVSVKEIEYWLKINEDIVDAAVLKVSGSNSETMTCYVVSNNFDEEAFISYLKEWLPYSHIPSLWLEVEEIPYIGAEVDKKVLRQLRKATQQVILPKSDLEEKLISLWENELNVKEISTESNFFELGGHSLKAVRILSAIRKGFNVDLSLRDIFLNPTVAQLTYKVLEQSASQKPNQIVPVSLQEHYPVSHAQRRIWVLSQFEKASVAYNMPYVMYIHGNLNVELFEKTVETIVRRHETLRTRFEPIDNELRQFIDEEPKHIYTLQDLSREKKIDIVLQKKIEEENGRVFDLKSGPLLSVSLLKVEKEKYALIINIHHIVSDGWSMEIFGNELFTIYSSYVNNRKNPLPPLKVHYKDYSVWHQKELEGSRLEMHKDYWKSRLQAPLPKLDFPSYKKRPKVFSFNGATIEYEFGTPFHQMLSRFSKKRDTSLFVVLLSVIKTLFYKYTSQKDLIVGVVSAGRNDSELENLIGYFINMLPLRIMISENQSFLDLLSQINEHFLSAVDHQAYPFDRLVEELNIERSTDRSAVFDVTIGFQNFEHEISRVGSLEDLGDIHLEPHTIETRTSQVDLTILFSEGDKNLRCSINYNTDIYEASQIHTFLRHLQNLAESIIAKPGKLISEYNYLDQEDLDQLERFNQNEVLFNKEDTVPALIAQRCKEFPDKQAIKDDDGDLTYEQLFSSSQRIAQFLNVHSIHNDIVGILMDRSNTMATSILGVWYSGNAYLPFDVQHPMNRLKRIVEDSGLTTLIFSKKYLSLAHDLMHACPNLKSLLCIDSENIFEEEGFEGFVRLEENDDEAKNLDPESSTLRNAPTKSNKLIADQRTLKEIQLGDPLDLSSGESLAYIIYTSGSTGHPKGVMIQHMGMMNHLYAKMESFEITSSSIILQNANATFDISVWQYFAGLLAGGTTVIYATPAALDASNFLFRLAEDRITIAEVVPSYLDVLLLESKEEISLPDLQYLLVTGEMLPPGLVSRWFKKFQNIPLVNAYGPTEASDDITHYVMKEAPATPRISLGTPIQNMRVYVVDDNLSLCPVGVKGEICVAGIGVGPGYLNDQEKTKEQFIANPFSDDLNYEKLYKTGDIGRWLPTGELEYFGRKDQQVKIRGHRIELGEIETQILELDEVDTAAVIVKEKKEGDKYLAAFVTSQSEDVSEAYLKSRLASILPDYLIPHTITQLDQVPLNENGKIDRKKLGTLQTNEGSTYEAPNSSLEHKLVEIWEQILNTDQIGVLDNFFELGGHSLKAIRVISAIRREFDVEVSMDVIFSNPTIAQLATYVLNEINMSTITEEVPNTDRAKDSNKQNVSFGSIDTDDFDF